VEFLASAVPALKYLRYVSWIRETATFTKGSFNGTDLCAAIVADKALCWNGS
jgi:hypothetical protein